MTNLLRPILLFACLGFVYQINAQGCSDAGFCTIGNFNSQKDTFAKIRRQEIDLLYTYGTHGKNERYYTPQLNYRNIGKTGSFFELRLPFNKAKDKITGVSYTGVGDAVATYNGKTEIKNVKIDYSVGLRVSFSKSDEGDGITSSSYPMFLQPGLGTTDFLAAINYDICKYLSLGTGVQLPLLQYNKNSIALYTNGVYISQLEDFRRQPDALLKLTGHYTIGKFKVSGGVLGIFHLANDYYDHTSVTKTNYELVNSSGTTINADIEMSYLISKKISFSLLYATPLQTRANTPEGLARSKIISPKITMAF